MRHDQTDSFSEAIQILRSERYNLGHFEGFNFRHQSAVEGWLTAAEVIQWDHDRLGEAEFWPAGDRPELCTIWSGNITATEIVLLVHLLESLGGDDTESLLRIHFALNVRGCQLDDLNRDAIDDIGLQVFIEGVPKVFVSGSFQVG